MIQVENRLHKDNADDIVKAILIGTSNNDHCLVLILLNCHQQ